MELEIHETPRPELILPTASPEWGEHCKRKAEVESNDEEDQRIKQRVNMNLDFILSRAETDPGDTNTHGQEGEDEATTIGALKIEVRDLKNEVQALKNKSDAQNERSKKDMDIMETLFNAINIVNRRLARAEDKIKRSDRKHLGVVASFRANLDRTNGNVPPRIES